MANRLRRRILTIQCFSAAAVALVAELALPASADAIEALNFTGTATCEPAALAALQECSPLGPAGPITGSYNLDVGTEDIVGAWSFTTPYGVISSSDVGASAGVGLSVLMNGVDVEAAFIDAAVPAVNALVLYWPFPNFDEIGPVYSPGFPFSGSGICQSTGLGGCEPDVDIAGVNSAASAVPEPGSLVIISTGMLGLAAIRRRRKAKA